MKEIKEKYLLRINEFKNNFKSKLKEYKYIIKPFFCIVIILTIAMSALIRADFNYIDDLGRVAEGYKSWDGFSRFASSFLSTFVHTSNYLTDISPLPQLLAILIMSIAGIIVLCVYKDEKKFTLWDIIAIIPLALSPYFLECLSYKYDSPYMALSVLASVFPLLFRKKNFILYSIIIILCTLLMNMTYQASSGIFIMLILLIFFKNWNNKESFKDNIKFLIVSTVSYLLGLIIFKVFIMVPIDAYVSNSILPIKELIPGTLEHLYKYFTLILSDFKKEWIILIGLMLISFIYVFVKDSKQKKYIALPISILALIFIAITCFGLYPVLTSPLFEPRAMYGFGVFIALIGVVIANSKKTYLSKIVVLSLSWIFIVFSFTYGNALNVQNEYTDFRVNLVIEDINDLQIFANENNKNVQIAGSIGQSPILRNMPQDYKILNRLVPINFGENWVWAEYYFYNYFDLRNVEKDGSINLKEYDLPILKDTMYHTIRGNEQFVLIELK